MFGNSVAVGIIEIDGYVAMAAAVEAMFKASDAEFVGSQRSGGITYCGVVRGEISAVEYALEAGIEAANQADANVKTSVLVRPDGDVGRLLSGPGAMQRVSSGSGE
mgnify:CR=1 FL=1